MPLSQVATMPSQRLQLSLCFNTFGKHLHLQRPAQVEQSVEKRSVSSRRRKIRDQPAIDLHDIDWQTDKVIHRSQARAKIIQSNADTQIHQPLKDSYGDVGILIDGAFRNLKADAFRRQINATQNLRDHLNQVRLIELARRKIHAHSQLGCGKLIVPLLCLQTRLLNHHVPDGKNQAGLFSNRQYVQHRIQRAVRPSPAQQRFKAFELAALKVIDRLIPDFELALIEGPP